MTQKEKLMKGFQAIVRLKSQAEILRQEAKSYDCKWPLPIAKEIDNICDNFLKAYKK